MAAGLAALNGQSQVRSVKAPESGRVTIQQSDDVERAVIAAQCRISAWTATSVEDRAAILERAADLIEERRGRFLHLLQVEGGKTIDDAVAEVREAADFCRYYAERSAADLGDAGELARADR